MSGVTQRRVLLSKLRNQMENKPTTIADSHTLCHNKYLRYPNKYLPYYKISPCNVEYITPVGGCCQMSCRYHSTRPSIDSI